MPEHYLKLQDASVLMTRHLLLTAKAIADLVEHHAMGAVVGPTALGKTFSISYALETFDGPVVRMTFDSSPTPKQVADRLMLELTGRRGGATKFEISQRLLELLAERPRLVVVGEAQNLKRACFETLRYFHDDPNTTFALLFDGGDGCWEVLNKEPMLRSRIYRRVAFAPLTTKDVAEMLPHYHPIYSGADPDLLVAIDKAVARGRLREWAKFTHTASRICASMHAERIDRELAEMTVTAIGIGE